jgi:tRNA(adenine34) deaminase
MSAAYDRFMELAYEEACQSLREGDHGFGAVVIEAKGRFVASAHDREKAEGDATSHAEMNAIRAASKKLGRDLSGCTIVSTHEPCPMCAAASYWSGISTIVYGYSIEEAMTEKRRRVAIRCSEVFEKAGKDVEVVAGVLHDTCARLYAKGIRDEIKRIRGKDEEGLRRLGLELAQKRAKWFEATYRRDAAAAREPRYGCTLF